MTVGEAFLSAFLQVAFNRLASREFIDFFRERKSDHVLKKLKVTLSKIEAVINDAEEKQMTSASVKIWLDELKNAAYDAEDVLDEYSTEALRSKLESESQISMSLMLDLVPFQLPSSSLFSEGIESKMEDITDRLDDIANQRFELGLKEGVGGSLWGTKPRLPTTSLNEACVYGRNGEKEWIIRLLLSDEENRSDVCVIPIVGMGGIGKTTLAQLVYNDERVRAHFDVKAWACVSEEFDVLKVTKTILESMTMVACEFKDLNLLQVRLKESLQGKKFLLVLDDVWNENYNDWDLLQRPFGGGARGSKIIVTTRNESVSSIMRTGPTHRMKQLSDKDCWTLFRHHAYGNRRSDVHPSLESIGKGIAKKCQGLPLAAKTLGGLLRSKWSIDDWEGILNSEIWDLPQEKSTILPALRLSYHYLPAHLKRCFAYCAIFPKNYEFEKEKLVLLWMAEGFLQLPEKMKRMEDLGDEFFRDLLSRSFFQQAITNRSRFVMHGLINDLSLFVSGEFCVRYEDGQHCKISEKAHHMSFIRGKYDTLTKFEALYECKLLRTFLPFDLRRLKFCYLDNKISHDLLPRMTYMRVLCLSQYSITELPDSFGNLKHLRYLDLSHTEIKKIPESTSTLYNLQTLLLCNCRSLSKLPADMGNLVNLRHLDVTGSKLQRMPLKLGKLKCLQTLSTFIVNKDTGSGIEELRDLLHLRGTLSISKLQNVVDAHDAMQANLKDKRHLDELVLEWSNNSDDSQRGDEAEVLDMLRPHPNLKKLIVKSYFGTRFSSWTGDPSFCHMVFLSLSRCKYCTSLPPVGQLPLLKDLIIEGMDGVKSVGPEFYGVGSSIVKPFQSLRTLKFEDMLEWQRWYPFGAEEEGFPCLRELSMRRCPKLLGELPKFLPSLQKIEIHSCQELTAVLNFPSLRKFVLQECNEVLLKSVVDLVLLISLHLCKIPKLELLPEGFFQHLTALEDLRIVNCGELKTLCNKIGLQNIASLRELEISECPLLEELPHELHFLTSLRRLRIKGCPRLRSFPQMEFPSMLRYVMIKECENLEYLPEWLMHNINDEGNCSTSLEFLEIDKCSSLLFFPKGKPSTTLKHLAIRNCTNLISLPDSLNNLTSLRNLHVHNCPGLISYPEGGLPTSIISLQISACGNLSNEVKHNLQKFTSLKYFSLGGCLGLVSFPEGWPLPTTLTSLWIYKLPNLEYLSEELQQLKSLEKLEIFMCDKLLHLPEDGLPASLLFLHIKKCPLLKQRCKKEKGEDWPKVAHIPCIKIDDTVIQ